MLPIEGSWVILLAAGDGSRLSSLTTDKDGISVPKQFCSLHGGASLLQDSLQRASTIVPRRRNCAVVAAQHKRWWQSQLWSLPSENIIEQPSNRGTAHGVLLALMHILERDPTANVVLLPCDHYVYDEPVLAEAIRAGLQQVKRDAEHPVLLGIEPEQPDPGLGYIVPDSARGGTIAPVAQFVEKPSREQALRLMEQGALWNAFIVVSNIQALLRLFKARMADLVEEMQAVVRCALRDASDDVLADLYRRLPVLDFSRHILQDQENLLRVLAVPVCGWSDLGTPDRLGATLDRLPYEQGRGAQQSATIHLNLAAQHAARQQAM